MPQRVRNVLQRYQAQSWEELKASLIPGAPARFDCTFHYTVYGTGDILVEADVVPAGEHPLSWPRLGLQLRVAGNLDIFTWYGRGPHEAYADRKTGAAVGVYHGTVEEQYVPYIMPQENGNKIDVRWVALTDEENAGLMVVGLPYLNVSAHYFTTQDLTDARHTYELKRRNEITLNLDYAQCGLGNASCGPGVLPQYLLRPQPVQYGFVLRPFRPASVPPVELSKEMLMRNG